MSQVDEMYKNLSDEEIALYSANAETEPHIVIGEDRTIFVPDVLRRLAVERDHNIETVTFDCPRYWDNHDMSKMVIYINYMRPDGYKDRYKAYNVKVDENDDRMMHFDWTVSRNVTMVQGNLAVLVCVKNIDEEGNESEHWHSELCKDFYISEGLECEDNIVEKYPDIVTQLMLMMIGTDRLEDGAVTDGKLASTYWQYFSHEDVSDYAYLDIMAMSLSNPKAVSRIKIAEGSVLKNELGDGDFIVIKSDSEERILLINLVDGTRWTYVKDSNKVEKVESTSTGGGSGDTVVDNSIVYIPEGAISTEENLWNYPFEEGKLHHFFIDSRAALTKKIPYGYHVGYCHVKNGQSSIDIFNLTRPNSYSIDLTNKIIHGALYSEETIYDIQDSLRTKLTVKCLASIDDLNTYVSNYDRSIGVVYDGSDYAYRYESYKTFDTVYSNSTNDWYEPDDRGPYITLPDGKVKSAKCIQYKTYLDGPDVNKKYMRVGGYYNVGTGVFEDLFGNGNLIEQTERMYVWTEWELVDDGSSPIVDIGIMNTYDQLRSLDLEANSSYIFTTGAVIASLIGYGPFLATYKEIDNNSDGVIDNGNIDRRLLKCIDLTQDVRWEIDIDNETCTKVEDNSVKDYVDEKLGDIDTALDSIIELQNSYIGGASE